MREDHDVAEIPLPQKFEHAVERVCLQPLRSFGILKERKAAAKKALTYCCRERQPGYGRFNLKGPWLGRGQRDFDLNVALAHHNGLAHSI